MSSREEQNNAYLVHTNTDTVCYTVAELEILKDEMGLNWSEKAVCLAWSVHAPRIKLLVERIFGERKDNIAVLSPEEVSGAIPNERNRVGE